jgi:molybdopterin molybdotransferase
MLHPEEALKVILERIPAPRSDPDSIALAEASGRRLAVDAPSDVDLPPFEKSMMDGYALRWRDATEGGEVRLRVVGESRAGVPFEGEVPSGCCIEIFTGAELPADCDAVEMIERTRREGDRVVVQGPIPAARNVSHLGEILALGKTVFEAGRLLYPVDLSVLASIGCDPVPVFPRPRVSVLTTGDELVPPTEKPGRGQIREGNTLFLAAALRALGCEVQRAGIVRDEAPLLQEAFRAALEGGDALVTTGGVSVGKYDLVGETFEKIGVEPILHKVAIKPGKPIWFGMAGEKPVFGLPGNPVSSLLGFEVFVRPALARMAGGSADEQRERLCRARWSGGTLRAPGRQNNVPARLTHGADGVLELRALAFRGSADIVAAADADALCVVPADREVRAGAMVDYRPLR